MIDKYSAKHIRRADKAAESYRRSVHDLIEDQIEGAADPDSARVRLTGIIAKLVKRFQPDEYRRVYVEEAVDKAKDLKDGDDFRCPPTSQFNMNFKWDLQRYENRLNEIEDAVRDRLDIETLAPDEGLVVISFYAYGTAQNITINRLGAIGGNIKFGPITDNEYFRVLKVKAGEYQWSQIWNLVLWWRTSLYLKRGNFNFTVKAGKLNYTGLFIYRSSAYTGQYANIHDRLSVVLTLLEQRYPELLDTYELTNGLYPDDRFIEFYMQEKEADELENGGA